jgi:hypothetical protein
METYAQHFIDEGLYSLDMIRNLCTVEDMEGFSWMNKFRKRAFLSGANSQNS